MKKHLPGNGSFPVKNNVSASDVVNPEVMLASRMVLFAKVVECMSFTAASLQLNCSKSAVSKGVASLEKHLGVKLLVRSTRSIRLTEAGIIFFAQCRRVLEAIKEAKDFTDSSQSTPTGTLRVAAPTTFGTLYVQPIVASMLLEYDALAADLLLSDRWIDVRREPVDVVISISRQIPSDIVAREIAQVRWVLCASPRYLARKGVPTSPAELVNHDLLKVGDDQLLELSSEGVHRSMSVNFKMRANNSVALAGAVAAGVGIALLPTYVVAGQIADGTLQHILPDWKGQESSVFAQFLGGRHMLPKIRVFIDHLIETMALPTSKR